MPSEAKTASKASVNLESQSRIRKRNEVIRSPRSIRRFRAAWVVQGEGVESEEVGGQQPGGLGTEEGPPAGVCSAWYGAEAGEGRQHRTVPARKDKLW